MKKPHLVVALAYDQLCTFEFGCVVEVFGLPRPELKGDWYRFAACAAGGRSLRGAGGLTFKVPHTLALLDSADTIIIPGWHDLDEPPPPALLKRLRAAHARGARICSICSGAFLLAATGLLDGREATTHWKFADTLAARHPAIRVRPDALYVDEGRLMTSAGSASGLDMMLHIVRTDRGAKTANIVARRLVIPPHRDGGQAQFTARPVPRDEPGRLSRLLDAIRRHPGRPHTLATMAAQALMTPRTLQRRFKDSTGMTPVEWVVRERVAAAREWLEAPRATLAGVAERAGFGSEESFRRHFRRIVGVSPGTYRQRFGKARA